MSVCFSGRKVARSRSVSSESTQSQKSSRSKLATQVMTLAPSLTGLVLCMLINPITTLWPNVENQLRGKLAPSHWNECR